MRWSSLPVETLNQVCYATLGRDEPWTMESYLAADGYEAWKKILAEKTDPATIIDMGANIAPKADHLLQYGQMGAIYMRDCLGTTNPRVGLLNIGEESSKGTDLLKEANGLLAASDLDFVGNVEGTDIFLNKTDVVVADGFTGNVVLKLLEGFSGFMLQLVLTELQRHEVKWGAEALTNVRRNIDYAEYGGALLLGVNGIVVIGHGKSDAAAVANACGLSARAMDAGVNEHIVAGLKD